MTDSTIDLDYLELSLSRPEQDRLFSQRKIIKDAAKAYLKQRRSKNRYQKILEKYFPSHTTQQQRQTKQDFDNWATAYVAGLHLVPVVASLPTRISTNQLEKPHYDEIATILESNK